MVNALTARLFSLSRIKLRNSTFLIIAVALSANPCQAGLLTFQAPTSQATIGTVSPTGRQPRGRGPKKKPKFSRLVASDVGADRLAFNATVAESVRLSTGLELDRVSSLAYDPGSSSMYGVDAFSGILLRIDPSTGSASRIGSGLGFNRVEGLAFSPSTNTLYGVDIHQGVLLRIDPRTGTATRIGDGLGFRHVAGLAFDADTNTLYGTDLFAGVLVKINPETGTATQIGEDGSAGSVEGLAYDSSTGTLFGVEAFSGMLVAIDTGTGIATNSSSKLGSVVQGLAFEVAGTFPTVAPTSVPEPSPVVILTLVGLGLLVGVAWKRSRDTGNSTTATRPMKFRHSDD